MKKWLVFLIIFAAAWLIPVQTFAVEYSIDQTKIDAYLQEDGNVDVEEKHTYSFEGEFNGITRTLIPKEGTAIEDVEAFENGNSLKVEQEGNLYKVYREGKNETVSVTITYRIKNGVEVFPDIGQFFYAFFDKSNESTYEDFTVIVHPPSPSDVKGVLGYDEAFNTERVMGDGVVRFEMGNVPSGENGNIRVAYDASAFPAATLSGDQEMLNDLESDKEELEQAVVDRENRKELMAAIAPYLIGVFTLLGILLGLAAVKNYRETTQELSKQENRIHPFSHESMSLPAMISFINWGTLTMDALTASFLDLVRKGNIEQISEEEYRVVHRETDFDHESILIQWLFDEIGESNTFHAEDVKQFTEDKRNHTAFQKGFEKWNVAVKTELQEYQLHQNSGKARTMAGIAAIALTPFLVLFPLSGLYVWMVTGIVLIAAFLTFAIGYRPLTVKGKQIKQILLRLKNGDQWKQWEKEDQIPALLYQIGIGKRKAQDSNIPASSQDDWMIFLLLAAALQTNFYSASQNATVSAAGNAGAGGGAGIGGGGGGSGAF